MFQRLYHEANFEKSQIESLQKTGGRHCPGHLSCLLSSCYSSHGPWYYEVQLLGTLNFPKMLFFVYYHRIAYIIFKAKVGLLDFRSHLKYGPFTIQPLFHFSKSRLVLISDPHCNYLDRGPAAGQLPFKYWPLNSWAD